MDATVIGFAGSLKPWHGTDLLINAFHSMRSICPSARLLIIGEGPEWQTLQAQASTLGLGESIVFAGRVDHAVMPDCLRAMDIAVAPYRNVPDFYFSPLKLYEYMASGLGVVASDTGDVKDLVRNGENGILCEPESVEKLSAALLRLALMPELRRNLGRSARSEAEHHSWVGNARTVVEYAARARREGPQSSALRQVSARTTGL
jgi:glycosyltransferase involved in cell wall biosynthesis